MLAQGGFERPHLRPKLVAFALEGALLFPELRHEIGDDPDAILENGQFLQDAAHARRASPATPRTSAPCFDARASTMAAIALSTSRSVNVRSSERNSSANAMLLLPLFSPSRNS